MDEFSSAARCTMTSTLVGFHDIGLDTEGVSFPTGGVSVEALELAIPTQDVLWSQNSGCGKGTKQNTNPPGMQAFPDRLLANHERGQCTKNRR